MENWSLSLNLIEAFGKGIPNLFPVRTSPRIWAPQVTECSALSRHTQLTLNICPS